MKYFKQILPCLLVILTLPVLKAELNLADYHFTLHIGAFVNPQMADFNTLKPYGFLYAEPTKNRLTRIYMGGYATESEAIKTLEQVKNSGYPDAFITRKKMLVEQEIQSIQLGSAMIGQPIDWADYNRGGKLYTIMNGNQLGIFTGQYNSVEEATRILEAVRKIGFYDARVNTINKAQLHEVTAFEAGIPIKNIVLAPVEQVVEVQEILAEKGPTAFRKGPNLMVTKSAAPESKPPTSVVTNPTTTTTGEPTEKISTKPEMEMIPQEYDQVVLTEKTGTANNLDSKPFAITFPNIRTKVKRTAVLDLQKILKTNQYYSNSLDGMYGKGTAKGWQNMLNDNELFQKYLTLEQCSVKLQPKGTSDILQNYINTLRTNTPLAIKGLQGSDVPIAKAYQAYYLLMTKGDREKINTLMNQAIRGAFKNKKVANVPKFDYTATYNYQNLDQLILHLSYIHRITPDVAVPNWLFTTHPKATATAFKIGNSDELILTPADHLVQWQELLLLKQMAIDLCADLPSEKMLIRAASQRAELLLAPQKITDLERKAIIEWNKAFWQTIEDWGKGAAILRKWSLPLKAAYLQSQIRLEDYYMDKGATPKEATGLAILTLKTVVEPYLSNL